MRFLILVHLDIAVPNPPNDVVVILVHLLRLLESLYRVLRLLYGDKRFSEKLEVLEFWMVGGEVSVLLRVETTVLEMSKEDIC